MFFKVSDYTHSGCKVDTRSVQIQPSSKVKVTSGQSTFYSVEVPIQHHSYAVIALIQNVIERQSYGYLVTVFGMEVMKHSSIFIPCSGILNRLYYAGD